MFVIRFKKIFLTISFVFIALSLIAVAVFGLKPGIDFTGGSALELSYTNGRPDLATIEETLTNSGYGDALVQPTGEEKVLIKMREITDTERTAIIAMLGNGVSPVVQEGFTSIGPSVGKELKNKAILSILLVLLAIVLFVAYAFRKVSQPVSSWKYGFAVIFALLHDIVIPTGIFAVIGHITGAQIDTLFIVALLTTLALSVSDTIVVFDRVRENLSRKDEKGKLINAGKSFEQIVGESLSQTFVRSINTSLMSLITVVALAVVGPKSTQLFAVILAIGMFFGIYSSIFMASPLLVLMGGNKKLEE